MTRNIDNRVEVGFPVYDEELKKEVKGHDQSPAERQHQSSRDQQPQYQ